MCDFQVTQPKYKILSHEIPCRLRLLECAQPDIFSINNKHYLCIVDYHSMFSVIKQVKGFPADNLIKTCKIIFAEYGLPRRLISGAGSNFLDIYHMVSSSCNHQSNGQAEACIKFVK